MAGLVDDGRPRQRSGPACWDKPGRYLSRQQCSCLLRAKLVASAWLPKKQPDPHEPWIRLSSAAIEDEREVVCVIEKVEVVVEAVGLRIAVGDDVAIESRDGLARAVGCLRPTQLHSDPILAKEAVWVVVRDLHATPSRTTQI